MGFDTEEYDNDVFRVLNGSLAKIMFSRPNIENAIFAMEPLGTLKTSSSYSSVSNPIIKCPYLFNFAWKKWTKSRFLEFRWSTLRHWLRPRRLAQITSKTFPPYSPSSEAVVCKFSADFDQYLGVKLNFSKNLHI